MSGPNDGDESWGKLFTKKQKHLKKLVYEDYFSDTEGNINKDYPSTLATYQFEEQNGKTVITGRAFYQKPEDLQKVLEMGHALFPVYIALFVWGGLYLKELRVKS